MNTPLSYEQRVVDNVEPLRKKRKEAIMESTNDGILPVYESSGKAECRADSPDIFADCSPTDKEVSSDVIIQIEGDNMCENSEDEQSKTGSGRHWLGATLEEIRNGSAPCLPPVCPSQSHTVFFKLPMRDGQSVKPYPENLRDCWDSVHVRMPFSENSLYPVQEGREDSHLRQRWELVQEALLKTIISSQQLEALILSYNSKYSERWDFSVLHLLFTDVFSEEETDNFFSNLLPKIVQLALQLPTLLTAPIPLLVQHCNHTLSFTQLQIASLLANAFLCTFPRRNTAKRQSEYARYPDINFNRLFQAGGFTPVKPEKLKCLLHYFRRVCTKAPDGVVTFTRRYLNHNNLPHWDRSQKLLTKLHITSQGTIEDDGGGLLQVDFANKLVGGGVLGGGGVQEEIRFVICPELIISRLFTEALDVTEALVIVGCERFSNYTGYSSTLHWSGDYQDNTPRDSSRRKKCAIVAIDALKLGNRNVQYTPNNLLRELNKAYVGFHCPESQPGERLAGVASGNWGCGAYRGDAKLKTLLQLMAASQAGRHLAYFTFGDTDLRDQIYHMYTFLTDHQVTVGQLWRLLCQYYEHSFRGGKLINELYPYLYQAISKKSNSSSSTTIGAFELSTRHTYTKPTHRERFRAERERYKGEGRSGGKQSGWLNKNRGELTDKELEEALAALPLDNDNYNTRSDENQSPSKCGQSREKIAKDVTSISSCSGVGVSVSSSAGGSNAVSSSCVNGSPAGSVTDGERRGSLLQYLEQSDSKSQCSSISTSSPTPKRKISDYFTSVPRSK
ncbi:poly(ADP-ribose) glycohydrolase isoform X2 [Periplaneta americana]|uniref:poly(ADP-ribose) glycohydrolase isoform X2 n=2 Tax=Periplaneta americana TaxID=6978 RepID=UPI0037E925E7